MGFTSPARLKDISDFFKYDSRAETSPEVPSKEPVELIEREHPLIEAMGVSLDALPEVDSVAAREIGDAIVKPFLDQNNQ